jgi:hypothetical protein
VRACRAAPSSASRRWRGASIARRQQAPPRSMFACVRSWSVAACVISVLCASVSLSAPPRSALYSGPEVTPPTSLGASTVQAGEHLLAVRHLRTVHLRTGCDPRTCLRSAVHGGNRTEHQLLRSSAKRYRSCLPLVPIIFFGQSLCNTLRRYHLISLSTLSQAHGLGHMKRLMCSAVGSTERETGTSGCGPASGQNTVAGGCVRWILA